MADDAKPFYLLSMQPVFRQLFDAGYRAFADHRHLISRACRLPPRSNPNFARIEPDVFKADADAADMSIWKTVAMDSGMANVGGPSSDQRLCSHRKALSGGKLSSLPLGAGKPGDFPCGRSDHERR